MYHSVSYYQSNRIAALWDRQMEGKASQMADLGSSTDDGSRFRSFRCIWRYASVSSQDAEAEVLYRRSGNLCGRACICAGAAFFIMTLRQWYDKILISGVSEKLYYVQKVKTII